MTQQSTDSTGIFALDGPLNRLPFDVWSEIVSYIGRHDLAYLCIVSSTFLSIFRPFLYRVVVFDGRHDWIPTLDLLARDQALASAVVELGFLHRCDPNPQKRATFNLIAIANLTSLRHFQFSEGMFRNNAEENQFWQILASKIRIPLEQLTYQPPFYGSTRPWYGDQYGRLGGLKIVKWNSWSSGEGALEPLWSVLSSSLKTLTSLVLPESAFLDHEYPHLAYLHFPNLRAFRTHPCSNPVQSSLAHGARMTNFVLVHDTIEELHFGTLEQLDAARLNANSLPRIRVFSGFLFQFNVMLSAQLTSLSTTLHRLTVYAGKIDNMFSIIQSSRGQGTPTQGCLPMLQQIRFSSSFMGIPLLEQIITGCAELFGSTLEVLKVDTDQKDLESGFLSTLVPLFEPFKRLRVIAFSRSCGYHYVLSSEERAQQLRFALPFVRDLFEQCASLREVRIYMSEVEHSWLVTSNPDDRGEDCPRDGCTGHLLYIPTRHHPLVMA